MSYKPMLRAVGWVYASIFAIAMCHYFVNKESWQYTKLFGGILNPSTPGQTRSHLPGELSFLTWIFHWSMIIDYCWTMPRHMWRWGGQVCTGNQKWKLYTKLHLPAIAVNAVVVLNHLHRDQIVILKLLHPLLVFIGSIATLYGSFKVSRGNGWDAALVDNRYQSTNNSLATTCQKIKDNDTSLGDWDVLYSLSSIAVASVLAYCSLYLTV